MLTADQPRHTVIHVNVPINRDNICTTTYKTHKISPKNFKLVVYFTLKSLMKNEGSKNLFESVSKQQFKYNSV